MDPITLGLGALVAGVAAWKAGVFDKKPALAPGPQGSQAVTQRRPNGNPYANPVSNLVGARPGDFPMGQVIGGALVGLGAIVTAGPKIVDALNGTSGGVVSAPAAGDPYMTQAEMDKYWAMQTKTDPSTAIASTPSSGISADPALSVDGSSYSAPSGGGADAGAPNADAIFSGSTDPASMAAYEGAGGGVVSNAYPAAP